MKTEAENAPPADEKAIESFTNEFLGRETEPKPQKKPDAVAPENGEIENQEAEKTEPKKPAKQAKKKTAPTPAPLTAEQITEAAARGFSKAVEKTEPEPAKPAESKLPADEQKRINTLKRMEQLNPNKYGGLAEKYEKSLTKLAEYAESWEKENPGKNFDEDAEEHADFKKGIEAGLDWDDEHYTDAVADIRADEKINKFKSETNEKFERLDQHEKLRQSAGAIEAIRTEGAKEFFSNLSEDGFENLLKADGSIDAEVGKKLMATEPVVAKIVIDSADLAERLVEENFKLFNNLTPYDDTNPLHQTVSNFVFAQQRKMLAKPIDEQRDADGRPFMAADKYSRLKPDEREKYWTFEAGDIQRLLVHRALVTAKQQIKQEREKFEAQAKARGLSFERKPVQQDEPEEIEEETFKPRTPAAAAPVLTPPAKGGNGVEKPEDKFLNDFING